MSTSPTPRMSREELIQLLQDLTQDNAELRALWLEQVQLVEQEHQEIARLKGKLDHYLRRIVELSEWNNELVIRLEALEHPLPEFGVQVHEDRRVRADG